MVQLDAHCHIWALDRGDYGWLDPADPEMAPIAHDFSAADLKDRLDQSGIARAVVVQAAPTEAETRWLLDQARDADHIAAVVGWVDLAAPDLTRRLAALATDPALRGIRPMLQDLAPDWLATEPCAGWAAALQDAGLRFDALVRPAHLETLLGVLKSNPNLPVVIDHIAKPALGAPPDDPRHALWRDGMARLAGETGACCKLSGILTEMAPDQLAELRETLFALLDQVLGWFGAERLMWGSDWPVLRLAGTYGGWHALSSEWLAGLSAEARAQISGATAARFYGVAP
ncbi:MAG: amidohydrolase family protein [Natronohydrobacter sp.]|nr:amidohydrolase family protein [Natronohydrobacter sp.]